MKLHLGFESIPYSREASKISPKQRRSGKKYYGQGKNTAQVSQQLEERYNIVEAFYALEEDKIVELIEEKAAMDIDDVITMGKPSKKGLSFAETDKIEAIFRDNLTKRKYDGVIGGVPTDVSIKDGRASFIRTGLYQRSFRAWMEE